MEKTQCLQQLRYHHLKFLKKFALLFKYKHDRHRQAGLPVQISIFCLYLNVCTYLIRNTHQNGKKHFKDNVDILLAPYKKAFTVAVAA